MNLLEACKSAREGNFVSHHSFDYTQSMHEFNGDLYYEDGANLTANGFIDILEHDEWSREGWFVKYSKEQVDREKLKIMHNDRSYTFKGNQSYEDCIIN